MFSIRFLCVFCLIKQINSQQAEHKMQPWKGEWKQIAMFIWSKKGLAECFCDCIWTQENSECWLWMYRPHEGQPHLQSFIYHFDLFMVPFWAFLHAWCAWWGRDCSCSLSHSSCKARLIKTASHIFTDSLVLVLVKFMQLLFPEKLFSNLCQVVAHTFFVSYHKFYGGTLWVQHEWRQCARQAYGLSTRNRLTLL